MRVGMALLLSLMIFATFNDVTRIINTPDEAPAVEKDGPLASGGRNRYGDTRCPGNGTGADTQRR